MTLKTDDNLQLLKAAERGDLKVLNELLTKEGVNVNTLENGTNRTALKNS
jgi:hypothetical protein